MKDVLNYVPGKAKKAEARDWRKAERRIAKAVGGEIQPRSGAGADKGDVKSKTRLVECKSTSKASFSVKVSILEKIEAEARIEGKIPALAVSFEGDCHLTNRDWIMIPARYVDQEKK